jgi:two-component system, sensor histidine kinase
MALVTAATQAKCRGYILIAEDERITAADLHASLTQLGYCVVASVASGEEAVARAGEFRPDIVIMDVRLRGAMDGVEAGQRINQQWGTPIIYLSAFLDTDLRERASQGAVAYLAKPFDPEALRCALESGLSDCHAHSEQ